MELREALGSAGLARGIVSGAGGGKGHGNKEEDGGQGWKKKLKTHEPTRLVKELEP